MVPADRRWLDFDEADIVTLGTPPRPVQSGTLRVNSSSPARSSGGARRGVFDGPLDRPGGLVATSITVPHA